MAVPSWLSLTFTIADFIVQRVDRVGPVELEASSDQPPERAQSVMDETVTPPEMDSSVDEAPPAEVDSPHSSEAFGFQAARSGGGGDPSSSGGNGGGGSGGDNGDGDQLENRARAGGGNDPTPAPPPDPGGGDDNGNEQDSTAPRAGGGGTPSGGGSGDPGNEDDDNGNGNVARVQCSFRAMRQLDQPTRYDVDRGGEGSV
jgi:hypothetical protein